MSLRDLVGADGCSAGSSTARNALTKALHDVEEHSRVQEFVREQQGMHHPMGPEHFLEGAPGPQMENLSFHNHHREQMGMPPPGLDGMIGDFEKFKMSQPGPMGPVPGPHMNEAFEQVFREAQPMPPQMQNFEEVFNSVQAMAPPPPMDAVDGQLQNNLLSFLKSTNDKVAHRAQPLPEITSRLSHQDKVNIKRRATIMARQMNTTKDEAFVNAQVSNLLRGLNISEEEVAGANPEFDKIFNMAGNGGMAADWVQKFHQQQNPGHEWAEEFNMPPEVKAWVDDYQEYIQATDKGKNDPETTDQIKRALAAMKASDDPRFKESDFYQMMQRLDDGEIQFKDGKVVDTPWAEQFEKAKGPAGSGQDWASEFSRGASQTWAEDFLSEQDKWADEFAEGNSAWAESFWGQNNGGVFADKNAEYELAKDNPYGDVSDAMAEGRRLFARGQLADAVLAFEAEAQRNPENAEVWLELGKTHAENDQDVKAIQALNKAIEVDPKNLEAHVVLAVSYANEQDQVKCMETLQRWLAIHPKYGDVMKGYQRSQADIPSSAMHDQTASMFHYAVDNSPPDADLHQILGVLYNVSWEYDKAIEEFQRSLQIDPESYSLWNKLGATQANGNRSDQAIHAYHRALSLKPTHVRAFTNLGIAYQNMNRYEEASKYYLGALQMNPDANHIWQYLGICFRCMERPDLLALKDQQNVEAFRPHFDF